MYRKLRPLLHRFVFIRQGAYNASYEGKIKSVEPDCIQLQGYREDGTEDALWTISIRSITEFSIGGRHLTELELRVQYAYSSLIEEELEAIGN
jgi:hypothetical protein